MIRSLLYALCATPIATAAPVALKLEPFNASAPEFREDAGAVEIEGPMSIRAIPATPPGAADTVLEFDYFCVGGVPAFPVLPGPPFEAKTSRMLPALEPSETWTPYSARIATPGKPLPAGWKQLRFDLPLPPTGLLQLRNVRLRPETTGEFDKVISKPAASATQEALDAYLTRKFPAAISKVSLSAKSVRIEGNLPAGEKGIFLADIPMDIVLDDPRSWENLVAIAAKPDGSFLIDLPRIRKREGLDYDRLASRWQLVLKSGEKIEPVSHARYAEWVASRSPRLPAIQPKSKKGLGGWNRSQLPDELKELGIAAVTVNMVLHSLVSLTPGPDTFPFKWQGRTYHARTKVLENFDATFRHAAKQEAMVSVILLVANPARDKSPLVQLLGHPDAVREGTYAMPNVTSPDGIALYGAILNLMAERWSRADGKYGRIHHWIIHNEVDAGWVWTNAGEKKPLAYLDLYQRSMRLCDLIARQYDPNSRPFITLTHHWAEAGNDRWYGSKLLLDLLLRFTRTEGDFPWALAHHPYPQNLFNPRAWEDTQATFSFDTKKVTPRNLEVLDAYMNQAHFLYQGKVRPIHLSENGFNSKDYSKKQLEDQAAGMAMAWKKMAALPSIESWQYHNWIDNRREGGLRIGLRKFPDEPGDPLGKKPIWHLYQALGPPREDAVAAPYLKTIGIGSWDELIHREPIR